MTRATGTRAGLEPCPGPASWLRRTLEACFLGAAAYTCITVGTDAAARADEPVPAAAEAGSPQGGSASDSGSITTVVTSTATSVVTATTTTAEPTVTAVTTSVTGATEPAAAPQEAAAGPGTTTPEADAHADASPPGADESGAPAGEPATSTDPTTTDPATTTTTTAPEGTSMATSEVVESSAAETSAAESSAAESSAADGPACGSASGISSADAAKNGPVCPASAPAPEPAPAPAAEPATGCTVAPPAPSDTDAGPAEEAAPSSTDAAGVGPRARPALAVAQDEPPPSDLLVEQVIAQLTPAGTDQQPDPVAPPAHSVPSALTAPTASGAGCGGQTAGQGSPKAGNASAAALPGAPVEMFLAVNAVAPEAPAAGSPTLTATDPATRPD